MGDPVTPEVAVQLIQQDIGYIKNDMAEIKGLLNGEHGLVAEMTRLKEQRSMAGKLMNWGLPALTGAGGALVGLFAAHWR